MRQCKRIIERRIIKATDRLGRASRNEDKVPRGKIIISLNEFLFNERGGGGRRPGSRTHAGNGLPREWMNPQGGKFHFDKRGL